jgi:N-methylhydantoinase A/oxoprolinase/acetone carboxylase beta subunit
VTVTDANLWLENPPPPVRAKLEFNYRTLPRSGSEAGRTKTSIWYRPYLAPGGVFHGPALIVEDMATLLVLPEFDGRVDDLGHIHLQTRNL